PVRGQPSALTSCRHDAGPGRLHEAAEKCSANDVKIWPDARATHGSELQGAPGDLGFDEPEELLPAAVRITDGVIQLPVGTDADDLEEAPGTGAASRAKSLGRPAGHLRFDDPERALPVSASVADRVVNRPGRPGNLQAGSHARAADRLKHTGPAGDL